MNTWEYFTIVSGQNSNNLKVRALNTGLQQGLKFNFRTFMYHVLQVTYNRIKYAKTGAQDPLELSRRSISLTTRFNWRTKNEDRTAEDEYEFADCLF